MSQLPPFLSPSPSFPLSLLPSLPLAPYLLFPHTSNLTKSTLLLQKPTDIVRNALLSKLLLGLIAQSARNRIQLVVAESGVLL